MPAPLLVVFVAEGDVVDMLVEASVDEDCGGLLVAAVPGVGVVAFHGLGLFLRGVCTG